VICHLALRPDRLPFRHPKPYIHPKVREANNMTIAAGFRCSDGIVLCSDSQITAPDGTKYNAQKIFSYSSSEVDAAFAFAGVEVFSKMCIERLSRCVLASEPSNIEQILRDEALAIHQTYSPQATVSTTDYDLDVLVAVRFRTGNHDELGLYHIEGPAVSPPIRTFDCIGIGRTVARQAINSFYKDGLSVQEGSRIAVFCLKQTKDHVDSCGGPSQVTVVWDDTDEELGPTDPYNIEQDYILEIERGFAALFEALRPVFLSFNDANPYNSRFAKNLADAARTIKKVWNKTFKKVVRAEKRDREEMERFIAEQNKPKKV